MIQFDSEIQGKKTNFGLAREKFYSAGCEFSDSFDYDEGSFDSILWREAGETIYLRVPFNVIDGALDEADTMIEFKTPYVIKHVVNTGLDTDGSSLMTAIGLSQFQDPLDRDGHIRDKSRWVKAGEEKIEEAISGQWLH
ncbi:YugN family protein [Ammoniphilus resinae]|uniref:YugN-like family protein n=1 Tax=Ammoniphilus resinae TaxID=861532 RepID=A0ABS4GL70_9BACL|nr:YugN family protein [Ammoniphilus resinae]MBP1930979.1 hypothetical protein [Ammoniphilus resinae]